MHVHSYYIYINVIDQFGFPGGSMIRICLPMQEMQGLSLDWVEPLQKEMATHSGILAWEILWTELHSLGLQQIRHNLVTKQQQTNSRILVEIETYWEKWEPMEYLRAGSPGKEVLWTIWVSWKTRPKHQRKAPKCQASAPWILVPGALLSPLWAKLRNLGASVGQREMPVTGSSWICPSTVSQNNKVKNCFLTQWLC